MSSDDLETVLVRTAADLSQATNALRTEVDDLLLHVREPDGDELGARTKRSSRN